MRIRTVVAGAVAVIVLVSAAFFALWHAISENFSLSIPGSSSCVVTEGSPLATAATTGSAGGGTGDGAQSTETQDVTLTPERMANAATIAAVGLRKAVPRRAMVIAFATALQESKLDNLDGGDRDSIGLFQQRPSQGWGTREQIADPRFAASAFYTALLKIRGWQTMRVTDAAQTVQRSAHPELYEQWAATGESLTRAFAGEVSSAVACTLTDDAPENGPEAPTNLKASLRLDWGSAVSATEAPADQPGVTVAVEDPRKGWQYAHWLVAHARSSGVTRVRYDDQEWTSGKGKGKGKGSWRKADASTRTGKKQVRADVPLAR